MSLVLKLRSITQRIIISLIRFFRPLTESKIVRFCSFTATNQRYLSYEGQGVRYLLHAKDAAVSRRIFIGKGDEHQKVLRALGIIQREGLARPTTLADIGANIGHICIPLVAAGVFTRAVGFEPEPENFKLFKINVMLNALDERIQCFNVALGANDDESLEFELSEDNFGDHRVRISNSDGLYNESNRQTLLVKSGRLDTLLEASDPSELMLWIDVQGFEGLVLEGASKLVKSLIPIGSEFWPYGLKRANTFDQMFRHLSGYGHYFDLALENPQPEPVETLEKLFNQYQHDDTFIMDILLIHRRA